MQTCLIDILLWIAPSERDTDNAALEKRLWDAADQFRANSGSKSREYSAYLLRRKITDPPHTLLDPFSAIVAPSFRLIQRLRLQIQNLRRTCELLLPRLLLGQVVLNVFKSRS